MMGRGKQEGGKNNGARRAWVMQRYKGRGGGVAVFTRWLVVVFELRSVTLSNSSGVSSGTVCNKSARASAA